MVEMGPEPRTAEWAGGLISSLPLHPFVIIQVWLSSSHSPNETCTRRPLPPAQTYPESGVHVCRLLKTHTLTHILSKYIFKISSLLPTLLTGWQTFRQKLKYLDGRGHLNSPVKWTFSRKMEGGRYSALILRNVSY